jgi:hypothetical protein
MLMKLKEELYNSEIYYELLEQGKGNKYRLQGILSTEKQTDFYLFIKRTTKSYYPDKESNCLVNDYIIPAIGLKKLVLCNLNFILESHDLSALNHEETNTKKTFGIYQT